MEKESRANSKIKEQNVKLKAVLGVAIVFIIAGIWGTYYLLKTNEKLNQHLRNIKTEQQEVLNAIEQKEKELTKIQDSAQRNQVIKNIIDTIEIVKAKNKKELESHNHFIQSEVDTAAILKQAKEIADARHQEIHQSLNETLNELDNIKEASKKQVRHLLDIDLIVARNSGDYEQVLTILDKADDFGVYLDDIIKHYAEITFIYLHGDQDSLAKSTLNKAENVGIIAAIIDISEVSSENDIASHLKKLVGKEFYNGLYKKYFPELLKIEGGQITNHGLEVQSYLMSKYPITVAQWKVYSLSSHSRMPEQPSWGWNENHPIVNVNWYEAVKYCNWLSEKAGKTVAYSYGGNDNNQAICDFEANGYRLPSEAEWEYAARGGNKTNHFNYSGSNELSKVGWYQENANTQTHIVGSKVPNELGLYDMTGNVWEWCYNWFSDDYKEQYPKYKEDGEERSYRGGSWYDYQKYLKVNYRFHYDPFDGNDNIGFRIACNSN